MANEIDRILYKLKDLASCYSFGRLLGYFSFFETIGVDNQLERDNRPEELTLTSSEREFLCGLWLGNIDLTKKGWPISEDDDKGKLTLQLMESLRKQYIQTDFSNSFKYQVFYGGDDGYDWQFLKIAKYKYEGEVTRNFLLKKGLDINLANRVYQKAKSIIEKQIKRRIVQKRKHKEYLSPLNLFVLSPRVMNREFSSEELSILKAFSISLQDNNFPSLNDIGDWNPFKETPIILLPDDRGLFIPNFLTLSIAMNETPFFWVKDDTNKSVFYERGINSEKIVQRIICKKFSSNDYISDRIIKKSKTGNNQVTDIDVLLKIKDLGILFQIKSKALTLASKKGNIDKIEEDFHKGIENAYIQGVKCISCLKDFKGFISLKEDESFLENIESYIVVCVTTETFPTITLLSPQLYKLECPFVAMTAYDLDSIFSLFPANTIRQYFLFRTICSDENIFGMNEMYFIGAFIFHVLGFKIIVDAEGVLPKDYAKFADYLINQQHFRPKSIVINSFEDIFIWFNKNESALQSSFPLIFKI